MASVQNTTVKDIQVVVIFLMAEQYAVDVGKIGKAPGWIIQNLEHCKAYIVLCTRRTKVRIGEEPDTTDIDDGRRCNDICDGDGALKAGRNY
jgi:hypothetical protein